jgi:hypothetical protein
MGKGLLSETFAHLRSCGAGREECVVYWTGPLSAPGLVDEVLHPRHWAGRGGYGVDSTWLNRTFGELADCRREIRVQVHSHPREAFHSATDDEFPIVQTPGFLSLVIPDFAAGPVTLDRTYLASLDVSGTWCSLQPRTALAVADVV